MLQKKRLVLAVLFLAFAFGAWVLAAGEVIEQKSVLNGTVLVEGLVSQNANVREGDVLVNISTVTGSTVVAARAVANGTVRQVLVKPGDKVKAGDVLLRIQVDSAR